MKQDLAQTHIAFLSEPHHTLHELIFQPLIGRCDGSTLRRTIRHGGVPVQSINGSVQVSVE